MEKVIVKSLMKHGLSDKEIEEILADFDVASFLKKHQLFVDSVKDNYVVLSKFIEEKKYCQNCPGLANCQKDNPHWQTMLDFVNGRIERKFALCDKKENVNHLNNLYLLADFPDELKGMDKSKIDITKNRIDLLKCVKEIFDGQNKNWLYIHGEPQLGKSFIAVVLVNELIKNFNLSVVFLNSLIRIKELNDLTFQNKDLFQELFCEYINADVLVFDNFGSEYKSDFIRDTIIYPLLSERAAKNKMTIFTSNFTLSDIETMYSLSKAGAIKTKQMMMLIKAMIKKNEFKLTGVSVY